ncbi:hypothetical protein [Hungatella hathewayi]|uniref:hypothetical protein n=1 Tax=Hungatella hathewayi TaxID=154046 RepID=UPI003567C2B5
MKYIGHCHEKGRAGRDKWGYPKVHMVEGSGAVTVKTHVALLRRAGPLISKFIRIMTLIFQPFLWIIIHRTKKHLTIT